MNITLYQSITAWPNKRWLAHMDLGSNCTMDFFGATEQEAKEKATAFYQSEKERWARIDTSGSENRTSIKPCLPVNVLKGRPGSVWMLNHVTRERARVEPSKVAQYEASGYVHGGPKTRFVKD